MPRRSAACHRPASPRARPPTFSPLFNLPPRPHCQGDAAQASMAAADLVRTVFGFSFIYTACEAEKSALSVGIAAATELIKQKQKAAKSKKA